MYSNVKNNSTPYYAPLELVKESITDMDTFPYPRFFRGRSDATEATVYGRPAGFRPREDACYQPRLEHPLGDDPGHCFCFQPPCSTTLPCYWNYYSNVLQHGYDKHKYNKLYRPSCEEKSI